MAKEKAEHNGPDLAQGIALSAFTSETLLGHVDDQDLGDLRLAEDQELGFELGADCRVQFFSPQFEDDRLAVLFHIKLHTLSGILTRTSQGTPRIFRTVPEAIARRSG